MKCKEAMSQILFDTMPSWLKYHDEKDTRTVRKVYSIGDLSYMNDREQFSSNMSKSQFEKLKSHIGSSSNLTSNNSTTLTSTFGKLLARKLTQRTVRNITKSTNDLNSNYEWYNSSIVDKYMIRKENIQYVERIGEGRFGIVFKGLYRTKQNELLAVAIKKFNSEFNYDNILKEIHIFHGIKHPHIVQLIGIVLDSDNSIMFINEYAHGKSLHECLISTNAKSEYSLELLLEYLKQIASAMSYLEKKSLIHQNLSCRNFLLFKQSLVKLSDLGCCHWNIPTRDRSRLPVAWMSPEAISYFCFTTASDVFSFGVSMWECYTYGQLPWEGLTNEEIANAINASNHQRLSRPAYATSELYQIMLHCWKYEPCERPTFSQLEKTLREIEFKQVRWKENNNHKSINLPDGFLSIESCRRGPLTILDRCLQVSPISSSSSTDDFLQCVSVDGQIGYVYNIDVEPLHIISFSKQNITTAAATTTTNSPSSTMNYIFHRKTGIKRNATKTKPKQISKDMISSPQSDFVHAYHIEATVKENYDALCITGVKQEDVVIEQASSIQQNSSLFDEVMQAFTEIYSESKSPTILAQDSVPLRSSSPIINFQSPLVNINQYPSDDITDSNNLSTSLACYLAELKIDTSNEKSGRLNGDLSEPVKPTYNLLTNRRINNSSCSSSTHDERSSSSSYNQEKSDSHSHYSSLSTDNDDNHSILSSNSRASSIKKTNLEQSITGKPLPPPPDLSSLGSKLTTATVKHILELPASFTPNKYRTKSMNNDYNLSKSYFQSDYTLSPRRATSKFAFFVF
ncbi:unnamed protein product [Rotaria socialis]|uniref:Protein kinase domain-containing protein n=1 Tax=Rotaria socialis TaxID=392032 RepID=A0A820HU41_9BILA|nr:unnamed protein product [Rotaria socialis]CAF3665649.1 unnamed protein product [Rotaria socialis]CAF4298238.1 unnamed protein product [Rotaria socialis]